VSKPDGVMPSRRDQTARRIIDGAASAFVKAGYAGTSMEDIAAAAGVSKLLLYRDFAGKRQLYQAVLERTVQRITERVPAEGTERALRELLAAARADPDGFTLVFRHAAREPEFAGYAEALTEKSIRQSEQILRRMEPDRVMRRWAAEMSVHTTYDAIITWLEHGDPVRDEDFVHRLLAVTKTMTKPSRR
jgi:AcrR family transcriptional regulator